MAKHRRVSDSTELCWKIASVIVAATFVVLVIEALAR